MYLSDIISLNVNLFFENDEVWLWVHYFSDDAYTMKPQEQHKPHTHITKPSSEYILSSLPNSTKEIESWLVFFFIRNQDRCSKRFSVSPAPPLIIQPVTHLWKCLILRQVSPHYDWLWWKNCQFNWTWGRKNPRWDFKSHRDTMRVTRVSAETNTKT